MSSVVRTTCGMIGRCPAGLGAARQQALRVDRAPDGRQEDPGQVRIWLEHDPIALALLVIGLAAVELLAFIMSFIV
jgi:hypothetical protein